MAAMEQMELGMKKSSQSTDHHEERDYGVTVGGWSLGHDTMRTSRCESAERGDVHAFSRTTKREAPDHGVNVVLP